MTAPINLRDCTLPSSTITRFALVQHGEIVQTIDVSSDPLTGPLWTYDNGLVPVSMATANLLHAAWTSLAEDLPTIYAVTREPLPVQEPSPMPAAAPRSPLDEPVTLALAKALAVLTLDERIRGWLATHDPKALQQANDALRPIFHAMADAVQAPPAPEGASPGR